jgi:hypothetical protein
MMLAALLFVGIQRQTVDSMTQTLKLHRALEKAQVVHATYPGTQTMHAPGLASECRTIGPNLSEITVLAPAGARQIPLAVGFGAPIPTSLIDDDAARAALTRGTLTMKIKDAISEVSFSLTGQPEVTGFKGWHRKGRIMWTAYAHRTLGRFGNAHIWITARAGTRQLDFIVNWHNGIPGPDILFESMAFVPAVGSRIDLDLPDCGLETGPAGSYVTSAPGNRPHILPQRHERSFRFTLIPTTDTPVSDVVGVCNWSEGGFLPGRFGVPDLAYCSGAIDSNLASRLTTSRNRLAACLPDEGGGIPVSDFWPAIGSRYGGGTGGVDMHPLDGVTWAWSGNMDAYQLYKIEQLRMRCRQRGCIYESDGRVVSPDIHLTPWGEAPWRMFNSQFERGEDSPWQFDRWPRKLNQAAYNPELFDPIDCQHLVRDLNHNMVLAWLAYDPLAVQYVKMHAALSRMTFWEGPGRANRMGLPAQPNRGTWFGRAEAWAALAIAGACEFGASGYSNWKAEWAGHLAMAQMPSGCFQAGSHYKEAKQPPYGTDTSQPYVIGSSLEHCYLFLALTALDGTSLLPLAARGFQNLMWKQGATGCINWVAMGPNSSAPRYITRDDWPADLRDRINAGIGIYSDAYHLGYGISCLKMAGAPEADQLLMRFTRGTSVENALSIIRSWKLQAPSAQTGAPIEQFWPILWAWR